MSMRVDQIRRELVLNAPIEKVWAALTRAEYVKNWFGDIAEIDLRPGGKAKFGWSELDDSSEAIVEIVERPTRFSYRWEAIRNTPIEEASTLVEFTLEAAGEGTKLTMVESGFASLPEDVYEHQLEANTSGWDAELGDLIDYLAEVASIG